jgi:hypothetical protein
VALEDLPKSMPLRLVFVAAMEIQGRKKPSAAATAPPPEIFSPIDMDAISDPIWLDEAPGGGAAGGTGKANGGAGAGPGAAVAGMVAG